MSDDTDNPRNTPPAGGGAADTFGDVTVQVTSSAGDAPL